MYKIRINIIAIAVFCLMGCSKESNRQEIDRTQLDLGFNTIYNTGRFREFCTYILSSDEEYSTEFMTFRVAGDSDNFYYKLIRKSDNPNFDRLGLVDGDIIVQVNTVSLTDPKDVRKVYRGVRDTMSFVLKLIVLRENTESLIEIPNGEMACDNVKLGNP